jgi:hypothetical protein
MNHGVERARQRMKLLQHLLPAQRFIFRDSR